MNIQKILYSLRHYGARTIIRTGEIQILMVPPILNNIFLFRARDFQVNSRDMAPGDSHVSSKIFTKFYSRSQ